MEIVESHLKYAESLNKAIDSVAKERKWLSIEKGFSCEETYTFMKFCLDNGFPQFLAVENGEAVGWCDIIPDGKNMSEGNLGIGVLSQFRGKGYGEKLLCAALARAASLFKKINLFVRADNRAALSLYFKHGFKIKKKLREKKYKNVDCAVFKMVRLMPKGE